MERIADAIRELSARIAVTRDRIHNGDKLKLNNPEKPVPPSGPRELRSEPQPTDSENRLDPQS